MGIMKLHLSTTLLIGYCRAVPAIPRPLNQIEDSSGNGYQEILGQLKDAALDYMQDYADNFEEENGSAVDALLDTFEDDIDDLDVNNFSGSYPDNVDNLYESFE